MRIPSPEWSRMVINLYRSLLKEGRALRYTDRGFFRREIRKEFERQRDEVDAVKMKDQYEVQQQLQEEKELWVYQLQKKKVSISSRQNLGGSSNKEDHSMNTKEGLLPTTQ